MAPLEFGWAKALLKYSKMSGLDTSMPISGQGSVASEESTGDIGKCEVQHDPSGKPGR
jgi:hypothetical protein